MVHYVIVHIHCESKNWTHFHLSITLANNYCPILIILSPLQTEINCDKCTIKSTTIPQIC